MKSGNQFKADLAFFSNFDSGLSSFHCYLAGICRARSDSPLANIMHTLLQFESSSELREDHKTFLMYKLYHGNDADVQDILTRMIPDLRSILPTAVTCNICMTLIPQTDLFPLANCGHVFHSACLEEFFRERIQESRFPLICPETRCAREVSNSDIQTRISMEDYQHYLDLTLNHYISQNPTQLRTCPTPNCQFAFVYTGESDFICQVCRLRYCLHCMTSYHHGITCEDYRLTRDESYLDRAFENFVKGQNYKQCPRCMFWVEKMSGCNHMTCKCGHHFCYACGGPYLKCACRQR